MSTPSSSPAGFGLQLVLIPGLMCDRAVWAPVCSGLDIPPSQVYIADHGTSRCLVDMAHRILHETHGPLAVAGHSMGGRVALEMMRLAPHRVQRLALLGTGHLPRAVGATGDAEATRRYALLELARNQGMRAMAHEWVQAMVHPDRLRDASLIEAIVQMFERHSADHFEAQIHALLQRADASDVLQRINCPVWLVCGEHDTWAPLAQHQAMATLLVAPRVHVQADAGHMFPMERPSALAQTLRGWLSESTAG
ncbi:MAG: hypothetical protein RLZZ401_1931 [Pseudomonadota bacterium]|jgi:pimeloyl-ACP methyl ester carboxylesterase